MTRLHEQLLAAIASEQFEEAGRLVRGGLDLNVRCAQGANLVADEPAASIYTQKPLELAKQAHFLMNRNKFDPVVKLLEEFGATD
jgi:hypothetical protein